MAAPAKRVSLAPTAPLAADRLTMAAIAIPDQLGGTEVSLGDAVEWDGASLVVTGTDPSGRVRVETATTEIDVTGTPLAAPSKHAHEAIFLVDASWSMAQGRPSPFTLALGALAELAAQPSVSDVLRRATIATFTADATPLASLGDANRLPLRRLLEVEPRGRSDAATAVSRTVALLLAEADPRAWRSLVMFTDEAPAGVAADALVDAVARARRLGVRSHFIDLGAAPAPVFTRAAIAGDGFHVHGASLAAVFAGLADDIGVPVDWIDVMRGKEGESVEFEVLLRRVEERA
ncbi:MAG: vWA domain-containing protein [Thermoplasmatota archaeon]